MSVNATSVFKDPDVTKLLSTIHDKCFVVPADNAQNNIFFACKMYNIQSFFCEVDVENNSMNKTYTATALSKEEIVENHKSVQFSFGLRAKDDDCDLPSMYWIPELYKNPYKQCYIVGSAKCTPKFLSKLLTSILTGVKEGLQSYHDTCYPHSGINSMSTLKNSRDLLETVNSRLFSEYNSIKTYAFFNSLYS